MEWLTGKRAAVLGGAALAVIGAPNAAIAQTPAPPSPAASAAPAASPQDAAAPTPAQSAAVGQVYQADFFARFAPRTAADMLAQVPGFVIRGSDDARGLGQASANVLINGARLSGKSDGTLAALTRVSAKNVLRIEVVDAATLDVPGLTGQVANVIATTSGITGAFAWRGEARAHFTDPMFTRFETSLSGKQGPVDFSLGLTNYAERGGAGGEMRTLRPDGSLIERRTDVFTTRFDQPKFTAAIKLHGPGSAEANFNFAHRWVWFYGDLDEQRFRPGQTDRIRTFRESEVSHDYEIGGDVAVRLGPGRLKLIGLLRNEHEPYSQSSVFAYADGRADTGDRYAQIGDSQERILRSEYNWKLAGGDWQWSAEAAFNRLDNAAVLAELDPAGQFVPVPFPGANGGVKESRYESQLSFSRALTPKLSVQVSGGGEFSRLSQTGDSARVREFWRPKGALSLAWVPAKGLDLSFKARRRVGQLNFGDFLAQRFLGNDNTNAGNAELVPPQSWEFEFEAKQTLGKWGTTTLRLFDYRITDFVDIIPIGTDGESPGNIDRARRQGIEWTSTFQLAPLGLRGAKLDAHVYLERSRLKDPLTGEWRPISYTQDRAIEFDFRHDIPGSALAWGWAFSNYHFGQYYRLGEVGRDWEGPNFANVFIEHKNVAGLTVQLTIANILNGRNRFERTVYAGRRNSNPVLFREDRDRLIGPIFRLLIKGTI